MEKKLGKLPAKHDPRTLRFERYALALAEPPKRSDWTQGLRRWGDMLNNLIGDCTCAAAGHLIMLWTQNAANRATPFDESILKAYSEITGYRKEDPDSDTGAACLDVLNYWRKVGIGGHKIDSFIKLRRLDREHIKQAVHLFGAAYCGVELPDNFERQLDAGQPWIFDNHYPPNPNSGHAVPIVAYDEDFVTFITWGQLQKASWEWWLRCGDEAYAILSKDFIAQGRSPSAFDYSALADDLAKVA